MKTTNTPLLINTIRILAHKSLITQCNQSRWKQNAKKGCSKTKYMLNYKFLWESSLHIGNQKLETKIFRRIHKLWGLQAVSHQEPEWFQGAVLKEYVPSAIPWEQATWQCSSLTWLQGCNWQVGSPDQRSKLIMRALLSLEAIKPLQFASKT